jgi:hypothetical protein
LAVTNPFGRDPAEPPDTMRTQDNEKRAKSTKTAIFQLLRRDCVSQVMSFPAVLSDVLDIRAAGREQRPAP